MSNIAPITIRDAGAAALLAVLAAGCAPAPVPADGDRFVMLDASGQPMQRADGGQHCVLDSRTQLTWEVKRSAEGLHHRAHTFSWYSTDKQLHMSEPGLEGGGQCPLERCDTEAMVAAVNAAGLCGHHDWRLPSRDEIVTLGNRRQIGPGIAMDRRFFSDSLAAEYWAGTTFRLYPKSAWAFDTRTGLDRADLKSVAKPVRLVRGTMARPKKRR